MFLRWRVQLARDPLILDLMSDWHCSVICAAIAFYSFWEYQCPSSPWLGSWPASRRGSISRTYAVLTRRILRTLWPFYICSALRAVYFCSQPWWLYYKIRFYPYRCSNSSSCLRLAGFKLKKKSSRTFEFNDDADAFFSPAIHSFKRNRTPQNPLSCNKWSKNDCPETKNKQKFNCK